jgi:hypothetical protein
MKTKCETCIYGGICIVEESKDFWSMDEPRWRINYKFPRAIYKYKNKKYELDYANGDYGCRAACFKSKEDVCLNNSFSEYKTIKEGAIV